MDTPSFPTDNLYKFCALVGATMVILIPYLATNLTIQLHDAVRTLERSSAAIGVDIKFFERDYHRADQTIADFKAKKQDSQFDDKGRFVRHITEEEFGKLLDEQENRERDLDKVVTLQKVDAEDARGTWWHILWIWIGGSGLIFFGTKLALYGFGNWFRIQKLQDTILEREATAKPT